MQEAEFQRAAANEANLLVALALAAGCDVSVVAQAVGICDDDAASRELALSDATYAALVAADAALALELSFEEPDEVDKEEVRCGRRCLQAACGPFAADVAR